MSRPAGQHFTPHGTSSVNSVTSFGCLLHFCHRIYRDPVSTYLSSDRGVAASKLGKFGLMPIQNLDRRAHDQLAPSCTHSKVQPNGVTALQKCIPLQMASLTTPVSSSIPALGLGAGTGSVAWPKANPANNIASEILVTIVSVFIEFSSRSAFILFRSTVVCCLSLCTTARVQAFRHPRHEVTLASCLYLFTISLPPYSPYSAASGRSVRRRSDRSFISTKKTGTRIST